MGRGDLHEILTQDLQHLVPPRRVTGVGGVSAHGWVPLGMSP